MVYNIFKEVENSATDYCEGSQEKDMVYGLEPCSVIKYIDRLKDRDKVIIIKNNRYDLLMYDIRKRISPDINVITIKDNKAGSKLTITADDGVLRINDKQIDVYSSIKTIKATVVYLGEYRSCHCGKLSVSVITGAGKEFVYEIKYVRCCCEYLLKIKNITSGSEMELTVEEEICERIKMAEEDYLDLRIHEWLDFEFGEFDNWLDSEYVNSETIETQDTLSSIILCAFMVVLLFPITISLLLLL